MINVWVIGAFYVDPSALSDVDPNFAVSAGCSAACKRIETLCHGFEAPFAIAVSAPPGVADRFFRLTDLPFWPIGQDVVAIATRPEFAKGCMMFAGSPISESISQCLRLK